MKILLNRKSGKQNKNVNNTIAANLIGSKKLLPQAPLFTTINELELYYKEREACNVIRLNCTINPICSNVLFNNLTEIVKNEGAPNAVKVLNYGITDGYVEREDFEDKIFCKHAEVFMYNGSKTAIKDTQISTEKCGYKYHCGNDIFNNHILRNNTFKTVCFNDLKTKEFNTLYDWMRDESGIDIAGVGYRGVILSKQHLYLNQDIETFEKTIDDKLIEKNGWFGFTNIGKFSVVDNNNETMDIFRVINYRRSCDFIQMYPSSDLWSFVPKYNPYLHRLEKNWNYCLTYPSSSTTKNITFIREETNSLKIMYFDDRTKLKNGLASIKIYSISKHGLKKGDLINLYNGNNIILKNCEVRDVENEYIFSIFRNGVELSKIWYEITRADTDTMGQDDFFLSKTMYYRGTTIDNLNDLIAKLDNTTIYGNISRKIGQNNYMGYVQYYGITYYLFKGNERFVPYFDSPTPQSSRALLSDVDDTLSYQMHIYQESSFNTTDNTVSMFIRYLLTNDRDKVYCGNGDERMTYYVLNHKSVNLDDNAQDLSFKQVVDNEELEYYVRIFSRLPNWKGCDGLIDQNQLYGTNKNLIERYQTLPYDFENHISRLSFAKNIYGDDIAEIMFTDDIDISYLQDNLGRPLTSIYLTIIKNNKGYKEWYGKNGRPISIRNLSSQKDEDYQIEYSHCFGMVNCAFRLSKESLSNIYHNNSMQLNNINNSFQFQGLDVEDLQLTNEIYDKIYPNANIIDNNDDETFKQRSYRSKFKDILNDEIQYGEYRDFNNLDGNEKPYLGDTHFYGDLCSYSSKNLIEKSIQQVEFRFNTAQRELSTLDESFKYFNTLYYDEILSDDLDENQFQGQEIAITNANQRKEGYCYYPHYEIPIKSFSKEIREQISIKMTITRMESLFNKEERQMLYRIKTMNRHNLQNNDTIYFKYARISDVSNQIINNEYYIGIVSNIIDSKSFECKIYDEKHKRINTLDVINILNYKLFKKDIITPSYAKFSKDGSCRFIWRDVIQNGFNSFSTHENYPFFNGALYVNKQINLFIRRQDPNEYTNLQTGEFPNDIYPNVSKIIEENNYYTENDIEC